MGFDPAVAYGLLFEPIFIYPLLAVIIGYAGWNQFIRKMFIIHVCIEQGQSLQEIKRFKVAMRKVGTTLNWVVTKAKGANQTEQGKTYIVDPSDILYTDRFNKSHIIQPYDQVFALHPFSDIKGKIGFMTLANAKADTLFQVVSKQGMVAKVLSLKQKLGSNMGTGMMALILIAGVAIGIIVAPIFGHYTGTAVAATTTTTTVTSITQTLTTIVSSSVAP